MRLSAIILIGTAVLIAVAAAFGTLLLAFPDAALAEEAVGVLGGDTGVIQWGFAAATLFLLFLLSLVQHLVLRHAFRSLRHPDLSGQLKELLK